jgi:hypothetical protein
MEPEKKQRRKSTGRNKKPSAEVKSIIHTLRFTEQENTELLDMVEKFGTTVSDFLRSKGLGAKSQVINGVNLIASLDKIGGDLGRAGNNINQLAKHANTINKAGKVDESIMSRFNVLFAEYIKAQQETQIALRKIIREVNR